MFIFTLHGACVWFKCCLRVIRPVSVVFQKHELAQLRCASLCDVRLFVLCVQKDHDGTLHASL